MKITTREQDSFHIVDLEGHLDTGTAQQLDVRLGELLADGAQNLLLNFSALEYVASSGMRVVLATAKKVSAQGGSFRLCGMNALVREVFDMTGFSRILDIYESEREALV